MLVNNFCVEIMPGKETASGYVYMQHNTQYKLVLKNNRNVRCDALVEVDGKEIGTFRIGAWDNITLERPPHDTGKFTFYKSGTDEARQIGLSRGDPELGLIEVTFTPERQPQVVWTHSRIVFDNLEYMSNAQGLTSGGTGLSGESNQKFHSVGPLNLDHAQTTIIRLRLVANEDIISPRRLFPYSNPTPPPIY